MIQEDRRGWPIYRLPPCPSYDVEGMESWLTDMARRGLVLAKDGIWVGIAKFERTKPRWMRYRLEAAPRSTSMWADHWGEPDPDAVALNGEYGWEYVAKRGEFYIYFSTDPEARELNTDTKVQAIAINAVRKRQETAVFQTFIWMLLYLLLKLRGNLLLAMIQSGTWFILLGVIILLWFFVEALMEALSLGRLRKRLLADGKLDHGKDWKKRTYLYYGKNCLQVVLVLIWVCFFFLKWNASILEQDKRLLADYPGEPPFATMIDFAGEGGSCQRDGDYNSVREWSDWIAPLNMDWEEHAAITLADGTGLRGALYVDYHETVNVRLARQLAMEYYRQDLRGKRASPLETPRLAVDYVSAYVNEIGFPTIVIQNGTKVIHATFWQISRENRELPLEEWVGLMADKILE